MTEDEKLGKVTRSDVYDAVELAVNRGARGPSEIAQAALAYISVTANKREKLEKVAEARRELGTHPSGVIYDDLAQRMQRVEELLVDMKHVVSHHQSLLAIARCLHKIFLQMSDVHRRQLPYPVDAELTGLMVNLARELNLEKEFKP